MQRSLKQHGSARVNINIGGSGNPRLSTETIQNNIGDYLAFCSFLNEECFCRNVAEVAVDYGRIARKSMMEFGRVGACVPDRVACKGASIVKSSCMIRDA